MVRNQEEFSGQEARDRYRNFHWRLISALYTPLDILPGILCITFAVQGQNIQHMNSSDYAVHCGDSFSASDPAQAV